MLIFLNLDGTARKVVPEHVYQGSNNVIAIDVIAPYPNSTALEIAFTLPNWEKTIYYPMSYVTAVISGNMTASAWEFVLPNTITQYEGNVLISINAIGSRGNKTSYQVNFNVEPSILPELPPAPTPDVYEILLRYIQQNSQNIVDLDKRVTDLENTTVRKVLRDFTVNSITGEGVKYYTDGTTATVQFPTGGTVPPVQSNWLQTITFSANDFNVDNEIAFSAEQTGFTDNRYIVSLERFGTADYETGDETTPSKHAGYWQTANTFFKGSDGSIYMQFNKPFSGRLVMLGGAAFSGEFIYDVEYSASAGGLVIDYVNGTQKLIRLPKVPDEYIKKVSYNASDNSFIYTLQDNSTQIITLPKIPEEYLKSVSYNESYNTLTFTLQNDTTQRIQLPNPSVAQRYARNYTVSDWQNATAPFRIIIQASEHGRGLNPVVYTGSQVFGVSILSNGTIVLSSTTKKAFNITII